MRCNNEDKQQYLSGSHYQLYIIPTVTTGTDYKHNGWVRKPTGIILFFFFNVIFTELVFIIFDNIIINNNIVIVISVAYLGAKMTIEYFRGYEAAVTGPLKVFNEQTRAESLHL